MEAINDFRPRNGWSLAAMIMFLVAFVIFIISIFIYESYRDKTMAWWAWAGFILSLVLLILSFSIFAFINIGGMRGYPRSIHHQPGWQETKTNIGKEGEIIKVSQQVDIPTEGIVSVTTINSGAQPSEPPVLAPVGYNKVQVPTYL